MFTLTCLPGLMCTADVFDGLAPEVEEMQVLPLPPRDDFDVIAAELAAALPERSVICGLSMGAYLALALARMVPGKVQGLILISGSAAADSPEAAAMRGKTADWARRKGVAALAEAQAQTLLAPGNRERGALRDRLRTMGEAVGLETFALHQRALAGRPDQTAVLGGIDCPTLVLTGEFDTVTPPEQGRAMARAMPRAAFREISGAGHLPPLEAPAVVAGHVASFLAAPVAEPARP